MTDAKSSECLDFVGRHLSLRYETAALRTLLLLKEEFGAALIGVLICGSVARGSPGPFSDLDIEAIVDQQFPRCEQRHIDVGNVYVDLVILDEARAQTSLTRRDDAGLITKLADAIPIYERDGRLASLVSNAKAIYDAGTRPISAIEANNLLGALRDLCTSIENIPRKDTGSINHCISMAAFLLIDLLTKTRRVWVSTKPARQFEQMQKYAPDLVCSIRALETPEAPVAMRVRILKGLIAAMCKELDETVPSSLVL